MQEGERLRERGTESEERRAGRWERGRKRALLQEKERNSAFERADDQRREWPREARVPVMAPFALLRPNMLFCQTSSPGSNQVRL